MGPAGEDGVSVFGTTLDVGDENCPEGGVAYTSASGIHYICHGADGVDGMDGVDGVDGAEHGAVL